jgi:hypothetical protein
MINWTPYKNSQGEWAEYHGLVLTAWHTGAWSAHDPSGKINARSSQMLIRPVEESLDAAKKVAEQQALEMLQPA